MSPDNPFLAARPYGPAESDMFFGRAAATIQLTERIDLNPLVILVSPSGIGKTSLLRASIMPRLERCGLSPVYLRPDPIPEADCDGAEALLDGRLAAALQAALLPDPKLEAQTLRELRKQRAPEGSLIEARQWFHDLRPGHKARKALLSPAPGLVERASQTARFLAGTVTLDALVEQWRRLDPGLAEAMASGAPFSALERQFASADVAASAQALRGRFADMLPGASAEDGSAASLLDTVGALATVRDGDAALVRPDGDGDLMPRIILVIDQFEQMFTLSSPQNRDRAFAMLDELMRSGLPLHLVLSLRKEWYADLIRQMSSAALQSTVLDKATYHLEPMTQAEATEVMVRVPETAGLPGISESRRRALWDALEVDDTVDAVVLSIACHELYVDGSSVDTESSLNVDKLLGAYLRNALATLADEDDYAEALDILGEIVGTGLTRDFVTQTRLLSAPLRDRVRRQRVLAELQKRFLIKGDNPRRGADKIYDIMHERLLDPMRTLLAERPDIAAVAAAANRVAQGDALRAGLSFADCRALLAARRRLSPDSRATGILLKSLLNLVDCLGDKESTRLEELSERRERADQLQWWRSVLRELAAVASSRGGPDLKPAQRTSDGWWMSAGEVDAYLKGPPDSDTDWLALVSTLRGRPSATTRQCIEQLAERMGA